MAPKTGQKLEGNMLDEKNAIEKLIAKNAKLEQVIDELQKRQKRSRR